MGVHFHQNTHLDRYINLQGSGLSGGEIQRLCIACALARKKKIIVLDEPTASIGEELAIKIITYIRQHCSTVIVTTHNPRLLALAALYQSLSATKRPEPVPLASVTNSSPPGRSRQESLEQLLKKAEIDKPHTLTQVFISNAPALFAGADCSIRTPCHRLQILDQGFLRCCIR